MKCILSQHILENALPPCISHYKDIQKIINLFQRAKSLNFIKTGKEKKIKEHKDGASYILFEFFPLHLGR